MDRKRYLELIEPALATVVKKHQDYNTNQQLADYFPFGDKSYVQMLHVKAKRLVSLASSDIPPNFESARDSVLDLINYAVFYLDHLDNKDKI